MRCCRSCSPPSFSEAKDAVKEAQREYDAAIDEATQGGTTLSASREAMAKSQAAYLKLERVKEEQYKVCQTPN
jgi:23S rRNA G2069 N7-methylase RlmK/C1962 C5-methylase RlmI